MSDNYAKYVNEGYHSFSLNKKKSECPYGLNEPFGREGWLDGWDLADSDADGGMELDVHESVRIE